MSENDQEKLSPTQAAAKKFRAYEALACVQLPASAHRVFTAILKRMDWKTLVSRPSEQWISDFTGMPLSTVKDGKAKLVEDEHIAVTNKGYQGNTSSIDVNWPKLDRILEVAETRAKSASEKRRQIAHKRPEIRTFSSGSEDTEIQTFDQSESMETQTFDQVSESADFRGESLDLRSESAETHTLKVRESVPLSFSEPFYESDSCLPLVEDDDQRSELDEGSEKETDTAPVIFPYQDLLAAVKQHAPRLVPTLLSRGAMDQAALANVFDRGGHTAVIARLEGHA